ncbi:MAG: peptidylprolyl isomerase [Chthonomonas sp.]|nr:peptidylprolyl isomerase [Chthonomonas sp.]
MNRALIASCLTLVGAAAMAATQYVVTFTNGKSFTIEVDTKGSPKTAAHVGELVKKKFYDGIRFHRVEDWVVQWGDPGSRKSLDVGGGGSGKQMPFEASKVGFKKGVVGIASTGSKVGGDCQLFVVTKDSEFLNGNYAVLGKVTKGMDVIMKVQRGDTIKTMKIVVKK